MEIDQDGVRRKRGNPRETRPGTIPDEGAQELRPRDETSPDELALQRGELRPEQLSELDDSLFPHGRSQDQAPPGAGGSPQEA